MNQINPLTSCLMLNQIIFFFLILLSKAENALPKQKNLNESYHTKKKKKPLKNKTLNFILIHIN
jgi:hypothetical protein